MSNRKLIILGIITACMIVWAVVQSHISNRPKTKTEKSAYLIQGLDPAKIDSILLGTGENKVTLKRIGGRFAVTNKYNYPAEPNDINNLITSCLDIKTQELYTDNPSNHKDLGVTEEDAKYIVKFLKPDSDILAGVIVGKSKEQGRGTFVRLIPGNKVYVTLERPWIKDQAMNYINRELVSVDRKNIESVTVSSSDETYTLKTKDDGEDIILKNHPPGKKLKDNDYENVFTALNDLRFEDVMKLNAANEELVFNRNFICRLKDSTVYTIKIAQKDDKTFITCQAEFTDKTPVTKEEGIVESEEELKKKEAKLLAQDKVEEFATRHSNWIYEIAKYDAKNLVKKLSELLEDEKEEETKDE
ncbi:MAG: hypothetical protein SCARUB_01852 [Candidatus Scalindua rubra]|uniref:DUF4340 domain-containing protein n=1 Tax=Candidatus Scalindua rubra TaxID=1872076 RepID=A0A1E3XBR0_9BACT|nr:MAG: hypothetical protein SCARUB_01852 [Candidatus Scalindua rubra]